MNVLITGGSGFIGQHTARLAAANGHHVVALARSDKNLPQIEGVTWHFGSLADNSVFKTCDFDAVIHLASHGVNPQQASWHECFEVNVTQSLSFWLAGAQAGISNFIICGSCFEYGLSGEVFDFIPTSAPLRPTGPYHASKAAASMAAHAFGISQRVRVYIPRPFHVFGDGEAPYRFWPSLRKAAIAGEDFKMTSGEQIRDFIPVEKVAQKLVNALIVNDNEFSPPVFENLGTGYPLSLREFAEQQWSAFNAKGKLVFGELPLRANEVMRFVPEISS